MVKKLLTKNANSSFLHQNFIFVIIYDCFESAFAFKCPIKINGMSNLQILFTPETKNTVVFMKKYPKLCVSFCVANTIS